jgi:hypothetical protein
MLDFWYADDTNLAMETIILPTKVPAQKGLQGMLSPAELHNQANPAFARLAAVVEERNAGAGAVNYSRTHHRHARSHTRR